MADFLLKDDFKSQITLANLDRVTNSDESVWKQNLPRVIDYASEFLQHRYDVDRIFKPIETWVDLDWPIHTRVLESSKFYTAIQEVPTGTLITDTDFWIEGDSRSQILIERIIDILLYNIYTRLNGSEIPTYLSIRYDGGDGQQRGGAIGYFKGLGLRGTRTADLPLLPAVADGTDQTGNSFGFGYAQDVVNKNLSI